MVRIFGTFAALCATLGAANAEVDAALSAKLLVQAKATYPGELCWWERAQEDLDQIQRYELEFRYDHDDETSPENVVTLYEMPCGYGAYNFTTIWFIENAYDGLIPLHFTQPVVDVTYADDTDETIEQMRVTGFNSVPALVNSNYDGETRTITNFSKWRGLGDASSSGTWVFHEGRFVLTRYEVDPTYDADINPVVVYDASRK